MAKKTTVKTSFSVSYCNSLREKIRQSFFTHKSESWRLADYLHQVKNGRVELEDGSECAVFYHWGFDSFADYARDEVELAMNTAYRYAKLGKVFSTEEATSKVAEMARAARWGDAWQISGYSWMTPESLEKWLTFAAGKNARQLTRALRCASRVPSLRSDPERALKRAESITAVKVSDTITLNKLSPKEKETLGLVLAIAKRVYPKACHKDAIMACLNRFVTLVKEGRAGTGWDSSSVDIHPLS